MNEADRLRAAMRATAQDHWGRFDVDVIMREGRRLRRRRRAARGATVMLSVVVVVVGVLVVLRQPERIEQGAPPQPPVSAPVATPATDATEPPSRPAIGEVLATGIRYGDDERVFYFVSVDVPRAPDVSIGLVAGRRTPGGELIADHLVNDVAGSDRRPGFHEIGYEPSAEVLPADPVPTFGYFVGPAAKIIGMVGKRPVGAELATWSADSDVVIFWFPPKTLRPGQRLDGILAWDAQGRQL